MKQYLIAAILLFVFDVAAFSQDKVLLKEDFKNNKNGWRLHNDSNFLVDIKKGVLHLQKFEKNRIKTGCLWYNKVIPGLNTLQDFSITVYARFLSGGDIFEAIDFQWGTRDKTVAGSATSLYQFNFFLNGQVRLDHFHKGWTNFVKKDVKAIMDKDLYRPKELNKYEIIQQGGFTIFKINNTEYFRQPHNPIAGNSIGFQHCMKTEWEIDKIIVKQLKETIVAAAIADTAKLITDQNLNNNSAGSDNGLKVYPNPFNTELSVNFTLEKEETVQIYFIDITGNILQQHTRKFPQGQQRFVLYAEVPTGSYVVKVQWPNAKALISTVVKQ